LAIDLKKTDTECSQMCCAAPETRIFIQVSWEGPPKVGAN
jgi:hypothetical protein